MTDTRPIQDLPSALDSAAAIESRLRGRPLMVCLDFDGTLSPIVSRPEHAGLSDTMRRLVADLACQACVAIISGRDLPDVAARVGLEQLHYAGSHGLEIAGPGGLRFEHEEAVAIVPDLDAAEASLHHHLDPIPGVQLERKRFSLAVHYRNVEPARKHDIARLVSRVVDTSPRLRQAPGKEVIEVRPDIDWDKGDAVAWLLDTLADGATVPVYVGDDLTDEDAFAALSGRGVTVVVAGGRHPTRAAYWLRGIDEVERFLELLTRVGRRDR